MRIVEINSFNYGSTGTIMLQIASQARKNGHEVYTCCPKSRSNLKNGNIDNQIWIGNRFFRNLHGLLGNLTGYNECFSVIDTLLFLKKLDKIKPDIIHLHNLHGAYINIRMLFHYIKKNKIKTIWTLHDCWAFTGHCPHFTLANCNKWIEGCYECPLCAEYPATKVDQSKCMWVLKKKWFTDIDNMTIVTPSNWLAELVKKSYLNKYTIKVINNGINLDVFKPTENCFKSDYGFDNKMVVLGVAFGWGVKKGLDVFCELSKVLDSERYQIVLVGTDERIDRIIPENITKIHRTYNQTELAKIYTAADVFLNPTLEDNYPTTNLEAIACGTPVITFNTGGSPECINENTGVVVDNDDLQNLSMIIEQICVNHPYSIDSCLKNAEKFNAKFKYLEYVNLYESVNSG